MSFLWGTCNFKTSLPTSLFENPNDCPFGRASECISFHPRGSEEEEPMPISSGDVRWPPPPGDHLLPHPERQRRLPTLPGGGWDRLRVHRRPECAAVHPGHPFISPTCDMCNCYVTPLGSFWGPDHQDPNHTVGVGSCAHMRTMHHIILAHITCRAIGVRLCGGVWVAGVGRVRKWWIFVLKKVFVAGGAVSPSPPIPWMNE